jgi:hypothetical protein
MADDPALHTDSFAANTVIHAVAGGFGSILGGGKFANGAITAAFAYAAAASYGDDSESTGAVSGSSSTGTGSSSAAGITVVGDDTDEVGVAEKYLSAAPQTTQLIDQAAAEGGTIYVCDYCADNSRINPDGTWVIHWNPDAAVVDALNGAEISPALALLHEIGHVDEPYGTWLTLAKTPTHDPYENEEELRVITQIENPIAKILGEGIRISHYGSTPNVSGPTVH